MKKKTVKVIGVVLVILISTVFIFAKVKRVTPLAWGHKQINTPMFGNEAINGYDPVAYFTANAAVKGKKAFIQECNGGAWYFSSKENLALFKLNPEKYAPQYGGYCAFAVSKGFTANIDGEVFKIINDKLYLCADKDVMEQWIAGGEEAKKKSEDNWK